MPDRERFPEFYIVGAPRSGTTFMFDYLGMHPQVFVPERKEPTFFAPDLDSGSYLESLTFMRDRGEYLALFAGARDDQVSGEASTWYLYSTESARRIKEARPDARIIAMLRHPVQMLYSLHGRRFYAGSEDLPNFADALDAEADRREGRRIPKRARNVKSLQYRAVGRYAEQLQRYLDVFGRDRVHVVVFDDFTADPPSAYRDVLRFLSIDESFEPDFDVVNAGAARRSQRLQRFLLRPGIIRAARFLIPPRFRPAVGRTWDRINSREEKREPLDPNVAAALRNDLLPDIERLSDMLHRDFVRLWT